MKRYILLAVAFSTMVACDKECVCTDDVKLNPCITINGREDLPDSLEFIRERASGSRDSLLAETNCFPDVVGKQRILVYRNDSLLTTGDSFEIEAADCCRGVPKTLDFKL